MIRIQFADVEKMMQEAKEARTQTHTVDMTEFKSLVWEQCKSELKLPTRSEYMQGAIEYVYKETGHALGPVTLSKLIRKCSIWHDALIIRFDYYLETITEETEEE